MADKIDEREADLFISHAWEDKEEVAQPLAEALRGRGLRIWYDEYVLHLGDSLHQKIDQGLRASRFGVVILSPHFFAKEWPQRELAGLFARETNEGGKVILPVWHRLTYKEVTHYSPLLADKLAVSTERGISYVAEQVASALGAEREVTLPAEGKDRSIQSLLERARRISLRVQTRSSAIEGFRDFIGLSYGGTREAVERVLGRPDALKRESDWIELQYGKETLVDLQVDVEAAGAHRIKFITVRESRGVERLRSLGLDDEKILIGRSKEEIEAIYGPAQSFDSGFLDYSTSSLGISFLCSGDQRRCSSILLTWWYE
ncbi:MAG: hypothetical protein QOJ16_69 [Acidobacteriota bacterium]|jgi:hypothetical protein|nr:hypothetical protein [Acidobacteriota bacterium]